jgi:hypothetical protein
VSDPGRNVYRTTLSTWRTYWEEKLNGRGAGKSMQPGQLTGLSGWRSGPRILFCALANFLSSAGVAEASDYLRRLTVTYLTWALSGAALFVVAAAAYVHTPESLMFLFVSAVSALLLGGPLVKRAQLVGREVDRGVSPREMIKEAEVWAKTGAGETVRAAVARRQHANSDDANGWTSLAESDPGGGPGVLFLQRLDLVGPHKAIAIGRIRGTAPWRARGGLDTEAERKRAIQSLTREADDCGADAVVDVQFNVEGVKGFDIEGVSLERVIATGLAIRFAAEAA